MKNNNETDKNVKDLKLKKHPRKFSKLHINSKTFIKKNNISERKFDNESNLKIKNNKLKEIKLPLLSYNPKNIIINNSPENNKIRNKTLNKKGKKKKDKKKYSSINSKMSILQKSNRINMGEDVESENNGENNKTNEYIEKNYEEEKLNNNEKDINDIIPEEQIKSKYSVFHFFKTGNLFIFIKNSKIDEIFQNNSNFKVNDFYEILEDFSFPPAYKPRMNKYKGMPKCIVDTCTNGSISLIKNEDNCNIIWKLLPPGKMRDLIRKLGKNQKFNHFPSTYQIGLKDNMYKHFKVYKRHFPKLYNFVPETYILPNDSDIFTNIYKKNKNTKWIVKPVNMSRGRGVHLLKDETELKNLIKKSYNENAIPDLISKYLDKPHLINNKKYDLRIYVLVASFIPLRFYIYYNGLVRFATEDYQKGNYDNVYIHITNYSINKNNINYKANQKNNKEIEDLEEENENDEEDDSSKWSLVEYRNYFKKLGLNNQMENIWKQIEEIIIKSLITVANDNCKEMSVNKNNSLFELYGYDIFIDESFRAWLIEVNVNPSLHCTSPLDLSIKTDLVTDLFNIVGVLPYNHNSGEPVYNYEMMKNRKEKEEKEEKEKETEIKKEKIKKIKLPQLFNANINNKTNDKNLINIRLNVVQNFDIDNLKNRIPEYDDEYYKKMIDIYLEEKSRAKLTGFTMIFPKKDNIDFYSKILAKENAINDNNIVLWEYILNNE